MKRTKSLKLLSIILSVMIFMVGCSNNSTQSNQQNKKDGETTKVGVVFTIAGLGGQSFNDLAFEGVKRAKEELGIEYNYVEPKAVSDQEITLDEMADSGEYDLIISIGFEQVDALNVVAKAYPDQKFALIDATVDLPNVASYVSKEEEGTFLIGALSALVKDSSSIEKLSNTKKLGFIGGVDSPLINKFAAGFVSGAKYIDSDYTVLNDYVGSFNDPTTAKVISETMQSEGIDLILHAAGASGMGLFQSASEKDFIAFGVNMNQNHTDPDHIMASMLKKVDVAAYNVIKSVKDNEFTAGTNLLGLKEEGVDITFEGSNIDIPAEILKTIDELKEKIIKGELTIPDKLDEVNSFIEEQK